jgi:cysteine-rich repeat protein
VRRPPLPFALGPALDWLRPRVLATLVLVLAGCGPGNPGNEAEPYQEFGDEPVCVDEDIDGSCAEEDCDDLDARAAPGLSEVLCNDVDDDCDPTSADSPDEDGDGSSLCAEDCDDDPLSAPTFLEQCRGGLDEDCDGLTDCFDRDCEGSHDCTAECGNGEIEDGEDCDDGNDIIGDGCSQCRDEVAEQSAGGVIDAPGDLGGGFYDANNAINGVRGGGPGKGSTDTFSLGYSDGVDNYLIIRWQGLRVLNGPGADVAVFENPFAIGGVGLRFMDQVILYFSQDGQTWVPFPHDYLAADETLYSTDPSHWQGFAGITPVLLNEDTNPVDPFDPELAGGDHFDLDELPDEDFDALSIKESGFSYLKLVSAPSTVNPDTGTPFVRDMASNGADIDGAYARYLVPD